MYKKSKRFLAGFLAFLLVVTMIPTDLLGVVYAADETIVATVGSEELNGSDANEVTTDTSVTLTATGDEITHIVWSTSEDVTNITVGDWGSLENKVESKTTSVTISGSENDEITLTAAAVKYTAHQDADTDAGTEEVEEAVAVLATCTYNFTIKAEETLAAPADPTADPANGNITAGSEISVSSTGSTTTDATTTIYTIASDADGYADITGTATADLETKATEGAKVTAPNTEGAFTFKAFAKATKDSETAYSNVVEFTYTVEPATGDTLAAPADPTANPANGNITAGSEISVSSTGSTTTDATTTIYTIASDADGYADITGTATADLETKATEGAKVTAPSTEGAFAFKAFAKATKDSETAYSNVVEFTYTVEPAAPVALKNLVLNMADLSQTTYSNNFSSRGFTIMATEANPVIVDGNNKTVNGVKYTQRLKFGAATVIDDNGNVGRSIRFETKASNAKVSVIVTSSNSNLVNLNVSSYDAESKAFTKVAGFNNDTGLTACDEYTVTVPDAGTYYIVGSGSGNANIYNIKVEYDGVTDVYVPQTVTVTFNTNGGLAVDAQTVEEGGNAIASPTVRDGYEFLGWYDNQECTGEAFDFTTPVTQNITLYAKWEEETNRTNHVLNMESLPIGSYSKNFDKNGFTVLPGDGVNAENVENNSYTDDESGVTYSRVLKLIGSGDKDSRAIKFTITEESELTIIAAAAGTSGRTLKLQKDNDADGAVALKTTSDSNSFKQTSSLIPAEGGSDYYVYGTNGYNIYYIAVTPKTPAVTEYAITVTTTADHATVTEGSKTTAAKDEVVELSNVATVTPVAGYELAGWEVKKTEDNSIVAVTMDPEKGYVFTMPEGAVTVKPVIEQLVVAKPVFDPVAAEGESKYTFNTKSGNVVLTTTTEGATIKYVISTDVDGAFADITADNLESNAKVKEYSNPIEITADNTAIKAIAVKDGVKSELAEAAYDVTEDGLDALDRPEATPAAGAVEAGTTVALNAKTGEDIYYTTDGTEPAVAADKTSVSGTKYTEAITISEAVTIKAIAVKFSDAEPKTVIAVSPVETFAYTIQTAPTEYTVTFKDGETTVDTKTVTTGSLDLSTVTVPTQPGKSFVGWKDEAGIIHTSDVILTVTGNMTLTAEWVGIPAGQKAKITLKKNEDDSAIAEPFEVEKNSTIDLAKYAPAKTEDGKVCIGWSTEKNGAGTVYEGNSIYVTDDMTLYPVMKNEADIEYTITFYGYYENSSTMTAKKDAKIKMPKYLAPVSGGTFKGWKLNDEGTPLAEGAEYTVTGNAEFYEDWDVRKVYDTGMDIRVSPAYYQGGTAVLPYNIEVYYKGNELSRGYDYTVKASKNKNAGTATLTISGIGNYKGVKQTEQFQILPRSIGDEDYLNGDFDAPREMTVITKTKVSPVITYKGKQLKLNKDFTLKEGSNIDAKGKYTGSATKAAELNEDGTVKTPAETRTMTIKGVGNYTGEYNVAIQVVDKANAKQLAVDMKGFKPVYGDDTDYNYLFSDKMKKGEDGKDVVDVARKIKVTDKKVKTTVLEEDKDFKVVWFSNGNGSAGTYKFAVVGIGAYTGSVTKSFKVAPKKDADIKAGVLDLDKDEWRYDRTKEPTFLASPTAVYENSKTGAELYGLRVFKKVTTKDAEGRDVTEWRQLDEYEYYYDSEFGSYYDGDYKVSYSGNKKAGAAAKAKINFVGDYKGTKAITVPFTVEGAFMSVGVIVPDMAYTKAGKKYVSKPTVVYDYDSEYGTGTILKPSEYTVKYEWASASDIKVVDDVETGYKEDKDVKVAFTGSDKWAKVRVTITPSAKSNYTNKHTVTEYDPEKGEYVSKEKEEKIEGYYYVRKGDDSNAIDLSKAKVEFYSDAACTTKLKAAQFDEKRIFTPEVDEKGAYKELTDSQKEEYIPVYVKVKVGKTEVSRTLYDVEWILGCYNAGKPTVLITGKGPSETPVTPAPAAEIAPVAETGAVTGSTDPNTPSASTTAYAVGSKTATIKIDPIKKWIEGGYKKTDTPVEKVTNLLKEIF